MTPATFKTLRESTGMSAEELADRMGVTRKTVYGFESPSRTIDVPEDRAAQLREMVGQFNRAASRAARRKSLPRFTDEARFQEVYGVDLPISVQGPLLALASERASKPLTVDYES